jgi:hypothetical protein
MMLWRVAVRSSCRAGSIAPGGRLSGVLDMVADAPGLESDTKLMWRGRRGVCRGESRSACLLERMLYGGSELALLMSPVEELDARATEGSSPVGNLLPPIIIQ